MPTKKRSYDDACGAARALDIIGERWSLLVVRELMLGPRRFTDLRAGLPGISANVLTQRLTELEAFGVVRRRKLPPPHSTSVYELTEWGMELEPTIQTIGRWGARSPLHPGMGISVNSIILSLRTMFDPKLATDISGDLLLRIGGQDFHAKVRKNRFEINPGTPANPDATIEAAGPAELGAFMYFGAPPDTVKVSGDAHLVERLKTLFPMPPPAPVPA